MAARIPRYESQQTVGTLPATSRASVLDAGAQALGDFGRTLGGLAIEEHRRDEQARQQQEARDEARAHADAAVGLSEATIAIDDYERKLRSQTTGDPAGYGEKVAREWAK